LIQLFVSITVFATGLAGHFRSRTTPWWLFVWIQIIFLSFSITTTIAAVGLWVFVLLAHRTNYAGIALNLVVPVLFFLLAFCYQVYRMPLHSVDDAIVGESYRMALVYSVNRYRLNHATILQRAVELIRLMFDRRAAIETSAGQFLLWPVMAGRWTVLWTQLGRTVASFGNVAVWWPLTFAAVVLLGQVAWGRGIQKSSQHLAIGWGASLLYFAFGVSERGVCDYQIALLFGLWALPLFIDAEASERIAGFLCAGIAGVAGLLFLLWAPLVYGYENFDPRFTPYFARLGDQLHK
jgi:hypothetical protein